MKNVFSAGCFAIICVSVLSVNALAFATGNVQGPGAQKVYEALDVSEVIKEPVRLGVRVYTKEVGGLGCKRITGVLPQVAQFSCTLSDPVSSVSIYGALNVKAIQEEPFIAGEWNEIKEAGSLSCTRRQLGYPHAKAKFHCWLNAS